MRFRFRLESGTAIRACREKHIYQAIRRRAPDDPNANNNDGYPAPPPSRLRCNVASICKKIHDANVGENENVVAFLAYVASHRTRMINFAAVSPPK